MHFVRSICLHDVLTSERLRYTAQSSLQAAGHCCFSQVRTVHLPVSGLSGPDIFWKTQPLCSSCP